MRISTDEVLKELRIKKSESKDIDSDLLIDKCIMALELKNKFIDYIDSRITNGGYPLTASEEFINGAKYAFDIVLDALNSFLLEPKVEQKGE